MKSHAVHDVNKDNVAHEDNKEKEDNLPDTGGNDKNLTLLGSLMALFGAVLLGRKRKNRSNK